MPNRKSFDDREKYDHSAHRTQGAEQGDLAPVPTAGTPQPTADTSVPTAGTQPTAGATQSALGAPGDAGVGRVLPGLKELAQLPMRRTGGKLSG